MNLYEAIYVRKTIKKYSMNKLDQKVLEHILNFAESIPMLFEDIKVKYKLIEQSEFKDLQSGLLPVKAPYYLMFYSTKESGYLLNAGNILEQIALYITARGLGNCYVGNLNLSGLDEGQEEYAYVITLAFGEGEGEVHRQNEKVKRLPLKDIVVFKEEVDKNIRTMVAAARVAPSGMNSQPWRMVVYNNRIHLFCQKNIFMKNVMRETRLLDMGICLAHLMLAAEELWLEAKPVTLNNISSQNFKKNDYVISIKLF